MSAKADADKTQVTDNPNESTFKPVDLARAEDGPTLWRNASVSKADFTDDNTFQIAMASEFPGEQIATKRHAEMGIAKEGEKYIEILSHDEKDVDLSRFNTGRAALLDEHRDNRHLGNIVKATLSADKISRAVVTFDGESNLSKLRSKQMRKGSRPNVSMGYKYTRYLGPKKMEDGRTGHRFAWMGVEVSSVAVPMDPTAGLNRSGAADAHCFGCGKGMAIASMKRADDGALFCSDECRDAETLVEESERGTGDRVFRSKSKEGKESIVSHKDLHSKVQVALDNDKRFKHERDNGNKVSDFYLHDIHQIQDEDGRSFQAIVQSPAWREGSKYFAVNFEHTSDGIELGDAIHVAPKQTFEAVARGYAGHLRMFRSELSEHFVRAGAAQEISLENLRQLVQVAAKADAKFNKKSNGDAYDYVWVCDILIEEKGVQGGKDVDEYRAVIQAANGKYYEVTFTFTDKLATLGTSVEVAPKTTYEAVRSGRSLVDSKKISRSGATSPDNNLPKKVMPKNVAELEAEAPALVGEIRTAVERTTRTAVLSEIESTGKKIAESNKEVRALADEMVKTHGHKWNGPSGKRFVVADAVRRLESEICALDVTHDAAERRLDFKRRAAELVDGAAAPREDMPADLPSEIASRCSLGRIMREGARAAESANKRSKMFMLEDGAEAEADKEIRKQANDFPGGASILPEGMLLPNLMPTGVRSDTRIPRFSSKRMKRDALAGDFATAGALIAPEFQFPIIELLRNWPALGRAGMTVLSGIMGNPVLPRQEAATTAQSIAEGGALAQYDQVLGQIKLSPHRVGTSQKYSRLALLQQSSDFEAMVMADHMAQMALRIDYLGLNGQGAGDEPLGVLNQLIQSVFFGGSAASAFANLVKMETLIRAANVPDEISYVTTSTARGTLKTVARLLTGATTVVANPIWENEEVNGRSAWDSQQVPNNVMLAGAFRHLVMAQWGGIAVVLDTLSQANQDKYWLNLNTYIDFALRHNQAFCRSVDSIAVLA